MTAPGKSSERTKTVASIAIFSALYMVLRLIPTVPMIGTGATFSLSDILPPIFGVILGPYVGGFSIIVGTFVAMGLGRPVVFLGLDFLPATINAVALGFLFKRKWAPVVFLYIALLLTFLAYPLTNVFINVPLGSMTISLPFAWLHIVAFVVLLSPLGRKAASWIDSLMPAKITAGLAILAFIGTMLQHLIGALLFETILAQPIGAIPAVAFPGIWTGIFFLYPLERTALTVLAVVIGAPTVKILKQSFFRSKK